MDIVKKRVLITAASDVDPYTISSDGYNDGSLMAVLRKKIRQNQPITDIYIYLSAEMAVREFRKKDDKQQRILTKAIKFLYNQNGLEDKINIEIFPIGLEKEITDALNNLSSKEIEDAKDIEFIKTKQKKIEDGTYIDDDKIKSSINENRIITNLIKPKLKIAVTTVNKFGLFYPTYYEMYEKIMEKDDCSEIYANISSGTSAMQEDLALIALSNKEKMTNIIQVSTPSRSSNNRGDQVFVTSSDYELKKLEEFETKRGDTGRATIEKLKKTRKVMLLQSLEDSFKKYDFAGVYDAISANEEIIGNKEILEYASNLYYRYIGNDEKARENEIFIKEHQEELYPIFDDNMQYFFQIRNIIERVNIMNVKAERNEINDWLLLAQTVIEALYSKLIYKTCNNFDIKKITVDGKVSYDKFEKINNNHQYRYLEKTISKLCKSTDKEKYVNAFFLKNILNNWWEQDDTNIDLEVNVAIIDKIRTFRNTAAHTDKFITIETLQEGFKDKIISENEYRIKDNKNKKRPRNLIDEECTKNVIQTTNEKIKEIIERICVKKSLVRLEDSFKVYDTIKQRILTLLKEEIRSLDE